MFDTHRYLLRPLTPPIPSPFSELVEGSTNSSSDPPNIAHLKSTVTCKLSGTDKSGLLLAFAAVPNHRTGQIGNSNIPSWPNQSADLKNLVDCSLNDLGFDLLSGSFVSSAGDGRPHKISNLLQQLPGMTNQKFETSHFGQDHGLKLYGDVESGFQSSQTMPHTNSPISVSPVVPEHSRSKTKKNDKIVSDSPSRRRNSSKSTEPQDTVAVIAAINTTIVPRRQMRLKEQYTLSTLIAPNGDLVYPCPFPGCGKNYGTLLYVRAHLRRHVAVKPFRCGWDDCQWGFSRSDELSRHERCHSGTRPFICTFCSKSFGRSDHLAKHGRVHKAALPTAGQPFPFTYSTVEESTTPVEVDD